MACTWLWLVGWCKNDALLDGAFDLGAAVAIVWTGYELV